MGDTGAPSESWESKSARWGKRLWRGGAGAGEASERVATKGRRSGHLEEENLRQNGEVGSRGGSRAHPYA